MIILLNFSQEKIDFWIEGIAVSFISIFGIFGEISNCYFKKFPSHKFLRVWVFGQGYLYKS